MTVKKEKLTIVLTESQLDALDYLIEEGIYHNRQEAIRDSLRILFGAQGISPFYPQEEAEES